MHLKGKLSQDTIPAVKIHMQHEHIKSYSSLENHFRYKQILDWLKTHE